MLSSIFVLPSLFYTLLTMRNAYENRADAGVSKIYQVDEDANILLAYSDPVYRVWCIRYKVLYDRSRLPFMVLRYKLVLCTICMIVSLEPYFPYCR